MPKDKPVSEPRFRTVAVPLEQHAQLKELAKVEHRSLARELASLIEEAYDQIILGKPGG